MNGIQKKSAEGERIVTNVLARRPTEAVAYVRVASPAQADWPESSNYQLALCKRYAQDRGLTIKHIYMDVGASGICPNRPGLERMLSDLCEGDVDSVVSADELRLARNAELLSVLLRWFARVGIGVFTSPLDRPSVPDLGSVLSGVGRNQSQRGAR